MQVGLLPARSSRSRRSSSGFGLVELLVAVGLLLILVSMALPSLRAARQSARNAGSLLRIRDLGTAVSAYSDSSKGLVPCVFAPVYRGPEGPWEEVVSPDGRRVLGAWFANSVAYYLPLDITNPAAVAAPGAPPDLRAVDYKIADTYYASRDYWNRFTQRGPEQWSAQRLVDTVFPSQKGLMRQYTVYGAPGSGGAALPACCVGQLTAAVLWADLSASDERQALLRPGEPNFWHHGLTGSLPIWADGVPIDGTLGGVAGTDR